MKNNINNSNKEFQNIIDCNFNKHWSWSILFKNLAILEQINKLPIGATVLEVGAANSYLKEYVKNNITRRDIKYQTMDVNVEYADKVDIIGDVLEGIPFYCDMIIASEIVEHFPYKHDIDIFLKNAYNYLRPGGILIITTPTPIAELDNMVWPDDHEYEFEFEVIYDHMNRYFEIEKVMPWSMKEREYNNLLQNDPFIQKIYCNLRGKLPESYIRALIALFADNYSARQTLLVGKKRRGSIC